jgi:cytochrome-b5 reductase
MSVGLTLWRKRKVIQATLIGKSLPEGKMQYTSTILMTEFVTHDVKRFILTRPENFEFKPGQGVKFVINEPAWKDEEGHPFTPTCLAGDRVLEFMIKKYPADKGVTERLHSLEPGAQILLSEAFGTITYKGEGTFIAAGAGVTPFIAIFRMLSREGKLGGNSLIFSNKIPRDIICESELLHYLGSRCILTCTRQSEPGYDSRRIDDVFLRERVANFDQYFYICGPDAFVGGTIKALKKLGAKRESLVFEK